MSLVWILTPIVITLGVGFTLFVLRGVDDTASQLRRLLEDLSLVRPAVQELRVETQRTRASMEELHRR